MRVALARVHVLTLGEDGDLGSGVPKVLRLAWR